MPTFSPAPPEELPKKIHFIWVGGPIPATYLRSIALLAGIAKKSDFEVNLWVDNEMNYHKTSIREDIKIPNLHIRHIDELQSAMKKDPFYKEGNRFSDFVLAINKEMIGSKNLAAAADLLRYEILRQEGGYYFDTDTEFELKAESRFITDAPLLGIETNGYLKMDEHKLWINGGNDIIGTLPKHPVLESVINQSLKYYKALEKIVEPQQLLALSFVVDDSPPDLYDAMFNNIPILFLQQGKCKIYGKRNGKDWEFTEIELGSEVSQLFDDIIGPYNRSKRQLLTIEDKLLFKELAKGHAPFKNPFGSFQKSPLDSKRDPHSFSARRTHTLNATGPDAFFSAVRIWWRMKCHELRENEIPLDKYFNSLSLIKDQKPKEEYLDVLKRPMQVANITVKSRSDQTWLPQKNNDNQDKPQKIMSYEASALDSARFFKTTKKEKKLENLNEEKKPPSKL